MLQLPLAPLLRDSLRDYLLGEWSAARLRRALTEAQYTAATDGASADQLIDGFYSSIDWNDWPATQRFLSLYAATLHANEQVTSGAGPALASVQKLRDALSAGGLAVRSGVVQPEVPDASEDDDSITYVLGRPLGEGAFGDVRLCFHPASGERYAIKLLKDDATEVLKRFQRETRILRKIRSPRIAPILGCRVEKGPPHFLRMPVYRGSLTSQLPSLRGSLQRIRRVFGLVLDGMEVAHGLGVVHRDLKPHNILYNSDDDTAITDFGLSRDVLSASSPLTKAGYALGTREYMAPEQFRNSHDADARCDIYSLGKLLYSMFADLPADGAMDLGRVPLAFRYVIEICTARSPDERFQSIRELRTALESAFLLDVHLGRASHPPEHGNDPASDVKAWIHSPLISTRLLDVLGSASTGGPPAGALPTMREALAHATSQELPDSWRGDPTRNLTYSHFVQLSVMITTRTPDGAVPRVLIYNRSSINPVDHTKGWAVAFGATPALVKEPLRSHYNMRPWLDRSNGDPQGSLADLLGARGPASSLLRDVLRYKLPLVDLPSGATLEPLGTTLNDRRTIVDRRSGKPVNRVYSAYAFLLCIPAASERDFFQNCLDPSPIAMYFAERERGASVIENVLVDPGRGPNLIDILLWHGLDQQVGTTVTRQDSSGHAAFTRWDFLGDLR